MESLNWITLSNPVAIWWIFLVTASTVNILGWSWTKDYLYRNDTFKNFVKHPTSPRALIWLSSFYVFGCAYRSFFPKADVQRICLFDTWLSSVFLGRSVATIAELAFVAQWAIILYCISKQTKAQFSLLLSKTIVPLIVIAEVFSWYAVITTNYFGNMIEESLWTITYTIIMICLIQLSTKLKGALRYYSFLSIFGSLIYVLFMIFVDVKMYYDRWSLDLQNNKVFLTFSNGLIDLNTRWHVTYDIADWQTEIPWMSLYFSLAVIVSILLCYVPLNSERLKEYLKHH